MTCNNVESIYRITSMKKHSFFVGVFTSLLSLATAAQSSATTVIDSRAALLSEFSTIARSSWTRDNVAGYMKILLRDGYDVEMSIIQEDSSFKYDLCLESLDMVSFLFDCEMLFQVRYDDSVMDYFDSLLFGQLVDATFLALNE